VKHYLSALTVMLVVLWLTGSASAQAYTPVTIEFEDASKLNEILDRKLSFQFEEETLKSISSKLQKELGIPIFLDDKALMESGVDSDTRISLTAPEMKFVDGLTRMLDVQDLTWMPKHGGILITTPDVATYNLIDRIYPVYDLIKVKENGRKILSYEPVIDIITSTVDPDTWEDNGGCGAIAPFNGSIVVSQTWPIHRKIDVVLAAIRKAQQQAPADWENIIEKKIHLKPRPSQPTTLLFPSASSAIRVYK